MNPNTCVTSKSRSLHDLLYFSVLSCRFGSWECWEAFHCDYRAKANRGALQKGNEFRDLAEFSGSCVEIFPEDLIFSCQVNSVGAPYPVEIPNKGKDVTIIVHGEEEKEEVKHG